MTENFKINGMSFNEIISQLEECIESVDVHGPLFYTLINARDCLERIYEENQEYHKIGNPHHIMKALNDFKQVLNQHQEEVLCLEQQIKELRHESSMNYARGYNQALEDNELELE